MARFIKLTMTGMGVGYDGRPRWVNVDNLQGFYDMPSPSTNCLINGSFEVIESSTQIVAAIKASSEIIP
jgi:hypothetical protein